MSHMLTVLKAYNESEFPGWREYDHAFCDDKMASTGVKAWTGMDMSLYQETLTIKKDEIRGKRPASSRPWVCFFVQRGWVQLEGLQASFHTSVRFAGGTIQSAPCVRIQGKSNRDPWEPVTLQL